MMVKGKALLAVSALGLGVTMVSGCRIDTHKNDSNKNDVKIDTPFGGMSVKTDDSVVKEGVGLTPYPGATLLHKDKDSGAADVNIGFGGFRLRVQALSYETTDAPDKVLAFYRKDMARYGTVILCQHGSPIGMPEHTPDGLTCEHDHNAKVHVSEYDEDGRELKAGSKQRQHIVGIDPKGTGTKIGLVALELPGHIGADEDKQ